MHRLDNFLRSLLDVKITKENKNKQSPCKPGVCVLGSGEKRKLNVEKALAATCIFSLLCVLYFFTNH